MLKTVLETALETALETVFETALETEPEAMVKKVLKEFLKNRVAVELTVTICLRGVRKMQRLAPIFWHFLSNVTISLHFYPA
ncbi:hypothetical protein ELY33_11230 [Vreelandella andesensis]|uniref:Uncharacterized protein n=1 Tax=Vreelandella andesensis TaxID=447567 RepID=A0A3S0W376_9GAMM|nr:hypothetical protein [Halomonas andesensis]RUR30356.1 hypothetical protein ELY33_11230 [Halomonas andesensis]